MFGNLFGGLDTSLFDELRRIETEVDERAHPTRGDIGKDLPARSDLFRLAGV